MCSPPPTAKNMAALHQQGLVKAPVTFARNEPVIVVPRGNPAGHPRADRSAARPSGW